MIFVRLFCNNIFSQTHIMFLFSLYSILVYVSILTFLCKFMVVTKVVILTVVQITRLLGFFSLSCFEFSIDKK